MSDSGEPPEERPAGKEPTADDLLQTVRSKLDRVIDPSERLLREAGDRVVVPAWRRVTSGEPRWPVSVAIIAAITMQLLLPSEVSPKHRWILPAVSVLLLAAQIVTNPRRITRRSSLLRALSLSLIGVLSIANMWSALRLIDGLIRGTFPELTPAKLLLTGGAIWLTNVIVFALWYWEFDRGGPAARAAGTDPYPDFLFPQMQSPEFSAPDWEPLFLDYLYVSFTNAAAFSPTDTMPLTRWAKFTMMVQSIVSLGTVALVVARAVNILK